MRRDDWLIAQLPVGMVEDDFFVRFVSIFQHLATTIMEGVDNLENVVDVTVAPEPMVRWLASWIGVTAIDASLPHQLQREIVRASARMLAWRGTRHGLRQFLELVSGGPVTIEDGGGVYAEGGAPRDPAWVRMRVTSTGWLPEADFVALVRDEVPAHVTTELWVGERQIWPAPQAASDIVATRVTEPRPAEQLADRAFAPPDLIARTDIPEPRAADAETARDIDTGTGAGTDTDIGTDTDTGEVER